MKPRITRPAFLVLLAALMLAACTDGGGGGDQGSSLTVYSGRGEEYVAELFTRFEEESDIDLEVRYGDSAEMAATLLEEGDASPADVFFSQDAGSLGAVAEAGLFRPLPKETLRRVDKRFRSPEGLWVGTSGRARVVAYNTDLLSNEDLPDSIFGFTDPKWKGRFGFPPTNSSFQAFVAGMILTEGEDRTRDFLEGLAANDPHLYDDNAATTRAVAAGEIEAGFVNHYYIYEVAQEDGEIPVANHFFTGGDPGSLVNVAGAGILESSDQVEEAEELLDYLTGEPGQTYFSSEVWEYPVAHRYPAPIQLVPLGEIESPDIDLSDLGGSLEPALELLAEVGLL